jgi:hypothetical protein
MSRSKRSSEPREQWERADKINLSLGVAGVAALLISIGQLIAPPIWRHFNAPNIIIRMPTSHFVPSKAFAVSGSARNTPAGYDLWLIVRAPDNLWYPVRALHVAAGEWVVPAKAFCISPGRQDIQIWLVSYLTPPKAL